MTFAVSLLASFEQELRTSLKYHQPDAWWNASSDLKTMAQEYEQALAYPLEAGGKRVRPLLLLLMAGSLGGQPAVCNAMAAACSLEYIHTYSLVHDDLPCMDNDSLRRGKPTTHCVYGEAKGLLVGDALLSYAFSQLMRVTHQEPRLLPIVPLLVTTLSSAAGGMVWGQWLDISFEKSTPSLQDLLALHGHKTGQLMGAALALGFLCGVVFQGPLPETKFLQQVVNQTCKIGVQLGLAFQIQDDILDGTQAAEVLGKTAGKDAQAQKTTALSLLGLEKAQGYVQQYTQEALQGLEGLFSSYKLHGTYQESLKESIINLCFRKN